MEDAQRPTHYFHEIYRDSEVLGEYKAAPQLCSVAPSGGSVSSLLLLFGRR